MPFGGIILITISLGLASLAGLYPESYAQIKDSLSDAGIHYEFANNDVIGGYSNPDFQFINNATSIIAYGLDAFWNDLNGSCDTTFECVSNYTAGWNDNASLQLSTTNTNNYTWSWIFGNELDVQPGDMYELITHMKLNDYAKESFVALEGYNQSSETWDSVELHCPEDVGWIPTMTHNTTTNKSGVWQSYSCEVSIPSDTYRVRPVLNAGWSSSVDNEGITWFDALSLVPVGIHERLNQTRGEEPVLPTLGNINDDYIIKTNRSMDVGEYTIQENITRYENPILGIKILYPSSWQLFEETSRLVILPPEKDEITRLTLSTIDISRNLTLNGLSSLLISAREKELNDFVLVNTSKINLFGTLRGEDAQMTIYEGQRSGIPIRGIEVYTIKDGKAYVFSFLSSQESYPDYSDIVNRIIETFEVYRDLPYKNMILKGEIPFNHGTIDFDTRINTGYGGPATASNFKLVANDEKNLLSLSLYQDNSSYAPNSFLMYQDFDGNRSHTQRPLNETIKYGDWYHVTLVINSTHVLFYLNNMPISILNRPSDDSYSNILLSSESASVGFKDLRVTTDKIESLLDAAKMQSWETLMENFLVSNDTEKGTIIDLVPVNPPPGFGSTTQPVATNPSFALEKVVDGLAFPTAMTFLAPDDILVLEKETGNVRRVLHGELLSEPVLVLNVSSSLERGLLGIAASNFSELSEPKVYLYYTSNNDTNVHNRLVRYDFVDGKLVNPLVLIRFPDVSSHSHNGGTIAVGPDKNVYVVVGDYANQQTRSQNIKEGPEPNGTGGILRVTPEGLPVGNGIIGDSSPSNLYYAYGIRNSFGLAFDSVTGWLWDTENGVECCDEINLVSPGFNSGWKIAQGRQSHNASFSLTDLENFEGNGKYSEPELVWNVTIGPTALAFLNSDKYGEEYKDDMFVAGFNKGFIFQFELSANRTQLNTNASEGGLELSPGQIDSFAIATGLSGPTDLKVGPDGLLYVLSSGTGEIFKLTPSMRE